MEVNIVDFEFPSKSVSKNEYDSHSNEKQDIDGSNAGPDERVDKIADPTDVREKSAGDFNSISISGIDEAVEKEKSTQEIKEDEMFPDEDGSHNESDSHRHQRHDVDSSIAGPDERADQTVVKEESSGDSNSVSISGSDEAVEMEKSTQEIKQDEMVLDEDGSQNESDSHRHQRHDVDTSIAGLDERADQTVVKEENGGNSKFENKEIVNNMEVNIVDSELPSRSVSKNEYDSHSNEKQDIDGSNVGPDESVDKIADPTDVSEKSAGDSFSKSISDSELVEEVKSTQEKVLSERVSDDVGSQNEYDSHSNEREDNDGSKECPNEIEGIRKTSKIVGNRVCLWTVSALIFLILLFASIKFCVLNLESQKYLTMRSGVAHIFYGLLGKLTEEDIELFDPEKFQHGYRKISELPPNYVNNAYESLCVSSTSEMGVWGFVIYKICEKFPVFFKKRVHTGSDEQAKLVNHVPGIYLRDEVKEQHFCVLNNFTMSLIFIVMLSFSIINILLSCLKKSSVSEIIIKRLIEENSLYEQNTGEKANQRVAEMYDLVRGMENLCIEEDISTKSISGSDDAVEQEKSTQEIKQDEMVPDETGSQNESDAHSNQRNDVDTSIAGPHERADQTDVKEESSGDSNSISISGSDEAIEKEKSTQEIKQDKKVPDEDGSQNESDSHRHQSHDVDTSIAGPDERGDRGMENLCIEEDISTKSEEGIGSLPDVTRSKYGRYEQTIFTEDANEVTPELDKNVDVSYKPSHYKEDNVESSKLDPKSSSYQNVRSGIFTRVPEKTESVSVEEGSKDKRFAWSEFRSDADKIANYSEILTGKKKNTRIFNLDYKTAYFQKVREDKKRAIKAGAKSNIIFKNYLNKSRRYSKVQSLEMEKVKEGVIDEFKKQSELSKQESEEKNQPFMDYDATLEKCHQKKNGHNVIHETIYDSHTELVNQIYLEGTSAVSLSTDGKRRTSLAKEEFKRISEKSQEVQGMQPTLNNSGVISKGNKIKPFKSSTNSRSNELKTKYASNADGDDSNQNSEQEDLVVSKNRGGNLPLSGNGSIQSTHSSSSTKRALETDLRCPLNYNPEVKLGLKSEKGTNRVSKEQNKPPISVDPESSAYSYTDSLNLKNRKFAKRKFRLLHSYNKEGNSYGPQSSNQRLGTSGITTASSVKSARHIEQLPSGSNEEFINKFSKERCSTKCTESAPLQPKNELASMNSTDLDGNIKAKTPATLQSVKHFEKRGNIIEGVELEGKILSREFAMQRKVKNKLTLRCGSFLFDTPIDERSDYDFKFSTTIQGNGTKKRASGSYEVFFRKARSEK